MWKTDKDVIFIRKGAGIAKRFLSLALVLCLLMSVTINVFAASNVKITSDYNRDGKTDFLYTLPNVIKTKKMQTADKSKWNENYAFTDQEVDVYTIYTDTKISMKGAYGYHCYFLDYKDGKLEAPYDDSKVDWNSLRKRKIIPSEPIILDQGVYYNEYAAGSYYSITKEGYYLFAMYPFASPYVENNPDSQNFGYFSSRGYKYGGAVILHVINPK